MVSPGNGPDVGDAIRSVLAPYLISRLHKKRPYGVFLHWIGAEGDAELVPAGDWLIRIECYDYEPTKPPVFAVSARPRGGVDGSYKEAICFRSAESAVQWVFYWADNQRVEGIRIWLWCDEEKKAKGGFMRGSICEDFEGNLGEERGIGKFKASLRCLLQMMEDTFDPKL